MNAPTGIEADLAGNVYISEQFATVRKINTAGIISRVAGGTRGFGGDGGSALNASIETPLDVTVDAAGNLYIADAEKSVVRFVNAQATPGLSFADTKTGSTSSDSPKTVTLSNVGNKILTFVAITLSSGFTQLSSTQATDCAVANPLAIGVTAFSGSASNRKQAALEREQRRSPTMR